MTNSELVQLGAYITRKQHAQLRELSAKTHIPIAAHLRLALDSYLSKKGGSKV